MKWILSLLFFVIYATPVFASMFEDTIGAPTIERHVSIKSENNVVSAPSINNAEHGNAFEGMDDERVERIEVLGAKPLRFLYKIREEKRFAFMEEFNNAIKDTDLHFKCKNQTATGSHVRKNVCRNQFDWRIIQEIVEDEVRRGNMVGAYAIALMGNKEQRDRREDLLETINQLIVENESFAELYGEFNEANTAYKKAHAKKFGVFSQYKE